MAQPQQQPPVPVRKNPVASNDNTIGLLREAEPHGAMHADTKSNLSPTSEFIRLLLLSFTSRYIPRAICKFLFAGREAPQQLAYGLSMGVGSTLLTLKYSGLVKTDIKNIYSEAVAYEKGVDPRSITFKDIKASDNRIVRETMKTYRERLWKRLGTDFLFFLTAPLTLINHGIMRHDDAKEAVTDLMVGIKGGMALGETWNRKSTMFEDLVTFVNNKINPRNGLGQPITIGEVFDLYQHYTDNHQPDKMFRNVLSRDLSEQERRALSQPVFTRITELMNLSYAYKHGDAPREKVAAADFPLPKFIYLLGHDLIDPLRPERTMAVVEIMNSVGAAGVKQAVTQIDAGMNPEMVLQQFGLSMPVPKAKAEHDIVQDNDRNSVIVKGSTLQLDATPGTVVDKASLSTAQLAAHAAQLAHS